MRKIKKEDISKVLVVCPNYIGDVLMTTPAIKALRCVLPYADMVAVVNRRCYSLLEYNPNLTRLFIKPQTLKEKMNYIKWLKRESFDIIINLQSTFENALLSFLGRGKIRIGFSSEAGWLFLNYYQRRDLSVHFIRQYLDLIKCLGVNSNPSMELYYPQEVVDYVEELLGNLSLNRKDFVVLSPFSTRPSKLWFNEKFALVADSLIEKEGVSVLFIGSESQKDSIDDIIKKMKYKAQNLAGRTNLLQAAELIKRSNLLISVDNGNMHMAVAINTPVIALFGSTNPSLSGPYGSQHKVLRENISCSPCYRHRCKRSEDRLCMELIQVEKVVKEAHRMLAKNSV